MSDQATKSDSNSATSAETKAEFARRMSWNKSTATRYAQQGKLVLTPSGLVDVDASLARLNALRDPSKDAVRERHQQQRALLSARAHEQISGGGDEMPTPSDPTYLARQHDRARLEKYRADQAELDLRRSRGELVEIAGFELLMEQLGHLVKDAFTTLADRVSPVVAAETDPRRCQEIVRGEARRALAELMRAAGDYRDKVRQEAANAH